MELSLHAQMSSPSEPALCSPSQATTCAVPKCSAAALRAPTSGFTRRVALGIASKSCCGHAKKQSLLANKDEAMRNALNKVHKVFVAYAQESPRFVALSCGSEAMLCMQRQSYRMGSRSARVVAQRARAAEGFFLDVKAFRWQVGSLSFFRSPHGYAAAVSVVLSRRQCLQGPL